MGRVGWGGITSVIHFIVGKMERSESIHNLSPSYLCKRLLSAFRNHCQERLHLVLTFIY